MLSVRGSFKKRKVAFIVGNLEFNSSIGQSEEVRVSTQG